VLSRPADDPFKPDVGGAETLATSASASRRTLLRLGLGSAALAVSAAPIARQVVAQTTVPKPTRLAVHNLALDHPILETYRKGIVAMKALPSTDRRSWEYQANIHYSHCPHKNWYFLPWHRAYLVELENIIRSLTLDPTFAMPYWDWTALPKLPEAFTLSSWNGVANPLRDVTRVAAPTDTLPAELTGQSVMDAIYAVTKFELFATSQPTGQTSTSSSWQRKAGVQGMLEATPHNGVHNWIGRDMNTMRSPRDPLFYLHHSNCDRIWAQWIALGNTNPADTLWREFSFASNFVRPTQQTYTVRVRDLLDVSTLGYQYAPQGSV
jgi:tyrosinase